MPATVQIRPVEPGDRERLKAFLSLDRPVNAYLLGMLEADGAGGQAMPWLATRGTALVGALVRTETAWLPGLPLPLWLVALSHLDCAPALATVIAGIPEAHIVGGPSSIVDPLLARLGPRATSPVLHNYDCHWGPVPAGADRRRARKACGADIERVAALHQDDEPGRADWARRFRAVPRRLWFAEDAAGEVVSSCHTHLETADLAVVGGVFTRPEARGRGWATACVTAMCRELLAEGKKPCVYYDGPASAAICRKVGFTPHARWSIAPIGP